VYVLYEHEAQLGDYTGVNHFFGPPFKSKAMLTKLSERWDDVTIPIVNILNYLYYKRKKKKKQ